MKTEGDKSADAAQAKGEVPAVASGQASQNGQTYEAEVKKETSKT